MEELKDRPAQVFLDASVVKHSIRNQTYLKPRVQTLELPNGPEEVVIYDIVTEDPTEKVQAARLKAEIDAIPDVIDLVHAGAIELVWNSETHEELLGVSLFPFHGKAELMKVPIRHVDAPFKYSRLLVSPYDDKSMKERQLEFLSEIESSRFLQLQKACGAYQGDKVNLNQLLDAFHVWCAEESGSDYFLTTDFKLCRLIENHKSHPPKVEVVTPSKLLARIEGNDADA